MYYTTKDIQIKYQKKKHIVENWLKRGVFPNAFKESGRWKIPTEDVERVITEKIDINKEDVNTMKKRQEIKGETFGALTILEVLGYRKETETHNRLFVEVGCECGNITEMPFYNIERGAQKYCSNQCPAKSGFEIGQTIYNLTIIGDLGIYKTPKGKGLRMVKTICRCGNDREVQLIKLKNGSIKSCSKNCKMNLTNIIGQKFNHLTVLEEVERENENGRKRRYLLCECDCGNEAIKEMSKVISGHTKFCGHICILQRGEGSPSWNPEKSWEDRIKGRDFFEYKQWRVKVYKRDDFTCQYCKKRGRGDIAAHHKDGYNWCIDRRIDIKNGVTLCEECHTDFHLTYGYGDNTEEQYKEWLNNKKVSV